METDDHLLCFKRTIVITHGITGSSVETIAGFVGTKIICCLVGRFLLFSRRTKLVQTQEIGLHQEW
jgi:hypothetical protein